MSANASPTPILDLKAPLPRSADEGFRPHTYVGLVVVLVLLVSIGESEVLLLPLGFLLVTYIVIAVHELGHVVAGLSVGFRFQSVAIGPVWIKNESGTLRFRPRRHIFGGLTYMSLDRIRRVRRRLIWNVLGGPVASLIGGVIALGAAQLIPTSYASILPFVLKFFGGYSLLVAFLSTLPTRSGPYAGDGLLLRTLLCSKEGTKQWVSCLAVNMLKTSGVDPLLWNDRWLRAATTYSEISYTKFHIHWGGYEAAEDTRAAAECLERCLADSAVLDSKNRDQVVLEAAFFMAWRRNDANKAAAWFNRLAHPKLVWPLHRIRAEIAVECACGKFDEALQKWDEGFAMMRGIESGKLVERARAS
jgi:hypothetical protein